MLTERAGKVWVLGALVLEAGQQQRGTEAAHQRHAHSVAAHEVRAPRHYHRVGHRGAELQQGRDVHGARGALGFHAAFIGGNRHLKR